MARNDSLLLVTDGSWVSHDGFVPPAGAVVNRVSWDGVSTYEAPAGCHFAPDEGEAIWAPPPPVPASVDMWKLQTVMLHMPSKMGHTSLLDDANQIVAQLGGAVGIAWSKSPTIDRNSINLAALAPQLGLSDADIDAAFISAANVTA